MAVSCKEQGMSLEEAGAALIEWNGRGANPWPPYKLHKAIVDYVMWVYDNKTKLGCGALRGYGFCVKPQSRCGFEEADIKGANVLRGCKFPEVRQFKSLGWPEYLLKGYPNGADAVQVYEVLVRTVVERNLTFSDPLYIGFREIARTSFAMWKFGMNSMAACRGMKVLTEDEKLVKLVVRGSGKRNSHQANGYRLVLPVPEVPSLVTH